MCNVLHSRKRALHSRKRALYFRQSDPYFGLRDTPAHVQILADFTKDDKITFLQKSPRTREKATDFRKRAQYFCQKALYLRKKCLQRVEYSLFYRALLQKRPMFLCPVFLQTSLISRQNTHTCTHASSPTPQRMIWGGYV